MEETKWIWVFSLYSPSELRISRRLSSFHAFTVDRVSNPSSIQMDAENCFSTLRNDSLMLPHTHWSPWTRCGCIKSIRLADAIRSDETEKSKSSENLRRCRKIDDRRERFERISVVVLESAMWVQWDVKISNVPVVAKQLQVTSQDFSEDRQRNVFL